MAKNGEKGGNLAGLHGFIIDCRTEDLEGAAQFWSEALRLPLKPQADTVDSAYRHLEVGPGGMEIEIQKVDHDSRVHIDLQAEDVMTEVKRLEDLGATIFKQVQDWVVMEAPTGHRFCVVPAKGRPVPK
jgi:predicted enzyme related to lactoylglutathione lyase